MLSTNEKMTLATAIEEGVVTHARMQQLLKLNSLEIAKLLTHLVSLQMLLVDGKGRGTTYTANSSFILSNDRKENDRKERGASLRRKGILDAIKTNNKITVPKIAQTLGYAESTINRDFAYLREHGYIIRIGGPKYGYWKILKEE